MIEWDYYDHSSEGSNSVNLAAANTNSISGSFSSWAAGSPTPSSQFAVRARYSHLFPTRADLSPTSRASAADASPDLGLMSLLRSTSPSLSSAYDTREFRSIFKLQRSSPSASTLSRPVSSYGCKTPIKMEFNEDVLVMDGILLSELSGVCSRNRASPLIVSSSSSSSVKSYRTTPRDAKRAGADLIYPMLGLDSCIPYSYSFGKYGVGGRLLKEWKKDHAKSGFGCVRKSKCDDLQDSMSFINERPIEPKQDLFRGRYLTALSGIHSATNFSIFSGSVADKLFFQPASWPSPVPDLSATQMACKSGAPNVAKAPEDTVTGGTNINSEPSEFPQMEELGFSLVEGDQDEGWEGVSLRCARSTRRRLPVFEEMCPCGSIGPLSPRI